MSRKKLPESEKKVKLSITLDVLLNQLLGEVTNNKSKFIENLIRDYFKDVTVTKNIDVGYDENGNYKNN